ncbi:MAG: hypothetical protein ACLGP3_12835, partial [Acidobacteriota bacterium]
MRISRRTAAKGLAAGTAAGFSGLLRAEGAAPAPEAGVTHTLGWTQVFPGVWRARLGVPEPITPVSSRLVSPQTEAFARLPHVGAAPLAA